MGPKRPSEVDIPQVNKTPKIEAAIVQSPLSAQPRVPVNNDFSGSVKKKLAGSSRTGQACDRCKVRKIRCDPRPEGCSPCAQNRTPCKTTDRITGKATTRGHTEAMEVENHYLRAQVAELHAQLKELGVEARTAPSYNGFPSQSMPWPAAGVAGEWTDAPQRRTSSSPLPSYAPATGNESSRPLPNFKQGSFGDNYLGVSSADSLLSNIKGTSLSVFGYEIDIADFVEDDQFDKGVMSYDHFLKVSMNLERVDPVPLPPYQQLSEYCNWYLRSLNPYTMLVHKPTLMNLVWRIGNEPHFQPTAAETVQVHMVLASLKYQISIRNGQTMLMEDSHQHYRYALSFFNKLLLSHTWQDVQALALISHHLRNFPKPGAAWIMISTTFLLAVELGFHRSAKAWADTAGKMDTMEIEMRKRIFWALHALASNICGKLGRPMPISMDDIDVEFPEPLSDCLPGEEANLAPFRQCSFQVGIQIAKYTVISSKLYGTLYAVNQSSRSYEDTLKHLEADVQQWSEDLPTELKDHTRASQDDYIFALYLEYWHQEYLLLLHHPSVCRSRDPEVINSNFDKCLSASQKMLHVCMEMRKIRSLDIPWINAVVYIAAIFTTLFIYSQRKDQLSPVDMNKLKSDMDQWVNLMGECGKLLDSGERLKKAIANIVEHSLSSINESIFKKTASLALGNAQESNAAPVYTNGSHASQYPSDTSPTTNPTMASSNQSYVAATTGTAYPYSNGTQTAVPQSSSGGFEPQSYGASQDQAMTPSQAAILQAASSGGSQQPETTYAYPNAQVPSNGRQPSYPQASANGVPPVAWQQWTRSYMQPGSAPQGEYLNTATTLMALGGREGNSQVSRQETQGAVEGSVMQNLGTSNLQWPGVQFGLQANGHVGPQ